MRHHWDALSCSDVLKGSQTDEAGTSNSATDTSKLPPISSGTNSIILGNTTNRSDSGIDISIPAVLVPINVPKEIVKLQSTPCKSMKAKYSVLQGISWGKLSPAMQM